MHDNLSIILLCWNYLFANPPRLPGFNYVGQNHYFVTFCCFRRQMLFLDSRFSNWLLRLLRSESAANSFRVHAYCLVPDHFHFLAEGVAPSSDLLHLVKSFKIKSSRQSSVEFGRVLWQRDFYQPILQQDESVESVAWYIWLNPVRKRIVTNLEEYPYSGTMTGWKMPRAWSQAGWQPPGKSPPGFQS
jgi:REP element-mobilizing transposase RayT